RAHWPTAAVRRHLLAGSTVDPRSVRPTPPAAPRADWLRAPPGAAAVVQLVRRRSHRQPHRPIQAAVPTAAMSFANAADLRLRSPGRAIPATTRRLRYPMQADGPASRSPVHARLR